MSMPKHAAAEPLNEKNESGTARTHYQVTFVVLAVAVGAFALLQSLVTPILPLLQTDLHTSQSAVTWVLTAYLLSASVATPILGRVGDMYGKKRVLVIVLGFLAFGSFLAALSTSIVLMIVARVIQGIGGGAMPLAFGIIRDEFPREKVSGAVGLVSALVAVGGGIGLVLAGPIVDSLGYHWLFWIPGIVVTLAALSTFLVVPESRVRTPGRIAWPAAILLSVWLVSLLLAVSEGPSWGWTSARTIGLLIAALVVAVVWIRVEWRSDEPLIDMRMMRLPAVWTTNLVAFFIGAGLYTIFAFLPRFTQTPSTSGYGFSASITESGVIVLPMTVAMFVAGALSGFTSAKVGAKVTLLAGAAVSVAALVMLAELHGSVWEVCVAMGLLGLGFGSAFAAMTGIVVDSVPTHQTGVASGMNANIRTIGGSIGAAIMAGILTSSASGQRLPEESGYTTGFAMLAGFMVLALVAGLFIPGARRARDAHQAQQAAMAHPGMAVTAGGTIVGDESE